ncbi:c-type cytochrome [Flavobacterium agricola]|uniref:C-type cytochrome n=1 Tax=Flavobacterium agricola TaxID=2870839 RepID=A0ABY6M1J1_9FLAO|nr:cbb3-type cytochrome c oxidase N-terminal domain-containing protein [Flavobacterium agricola]UYW02418.1 c-type cytochrome [Flavobacterium agricola]
MKKFFPPYVRVPLLFVLFYFAVEYTIDSGNQPAFVKYPIVLLLYGFFFLTLIAVEALVSATNKLLNRLLTPEQRAAQELEDNKPLSEAQWYKKLMARLTRSKSIEEEGTIVLDHDYDGIKELDNDLPPWWTALFYLTAIFGVVYLVKYEVLGYDNQDQEYVKEVAKAEEQIAIYNLTAPDKTSVDNVKLLTDPSDLAKGKAIYETNCIACHRPDGGGSIGPNLTDNYWILGGSVQDVFHTIMEGGRAGKGMIPWKDQIKPADIEKVTSYVLSLVGTNPADPKAPEGDLYVSETTATTSNETEVTETVVEEEGVTP